MVFHVSRSKSTKTRLQCRQQWRQGACEGELPAAKDCDKEDVKVANEEVMQRIVQMARMYNMPPEKFAKDLQKRNGMIEIFDQIMNQKVMDLLESAAKVEEVPVGSLPESPTPA